MAQPFRLVAWHKRRGQNDSGPWTAAEAFTPVSLATDEELPYALTLRSTLAGQADHKAPQARLNTATSQPIKS